MSRKFKRLKDNAKCGMQQSKKVNSAAFDGGEWGIESQGDGLGIRVKEMLRVCAEKARLFDGYASARDEQS